MKRNNKINPDADFFINSGRSLTKSEQEELSAYFKQQKAKRTKKESARIKQMSRLLSQKFA